MWPSFENKISKMVLSQAKYYDKMMSHSNYSLNDLCWNEINLEQGKALKVLKPERKLYKIPAFGTSTYAGIHCLHSTARKPPSWPVVLMLPPSMASNATEEPLSFLNEQLVSNKTLRTVGNREEVYIQPRFVAGKSKMVSIRLKQTFMTEDGVTISSAWRAEFPFWHD